MRLCIIDADYGEEDGRSVIKLYCKDIKGKTIIAFDRNYEPYFYVLPTTGHEADVKKKIESHFGKCIKRIDIVEKQIGIEKRKFLKIICYVSSDIQKIRNTVKMWERKHGGTGIVEEEYEYTIPLHKRYLIEKGISGACWVDVDGTQERSFINIKDIKPAICTDLPQLSLLSFDIENVEEKGKQKIIMLSLAGPNYKKVLTYQQGHFPSYVEVVEDEKALLERFVEIVNEKDPDIILGFMSDEHDFHIIAQRASELKVPLKIGRDGSAVRFVHGKTVSRARIKGRPHIDLFSFVLDILAPQLQTEVMTLEAISSELLGDTKIEMEFEEILEAWRKKKDLAKLAEYCLKDSELVLRLADLLLPQIWELCKVVGQLPFDVSRMTYGQLVEWYLMRCAHELGYVIPNKPKFEEIAERLGRPTYVGGYVKEPMVGLHEGIAVLDFKSLYPSIIATFNISPETLNVGPRTSGWQVPDERFWFCKKPSGFVSIVINKLIERRKELKAKMAKVKGPEKTRLANEQQAVKTIANATYGMMAFAGATWYCAECARSAAAFGRYYIKKVIAAAERNGFDVVYADTDSCFVKLKGKGNLESATERFLKRVNAELPGMLELDIQGYYKRGIFIPLETKLGAAKKKYALIDKDGKLTIRGLERVRGDWSQLARTTQEKVLRLVLAKKDIKGAIKVVKSAIAKLKAGKVPLHDLAIYESLSKPLSAYKVISPHTVVAHKMIERGRAVGVGMVMIYVITKGKGPISKRAEPIEDVSLNDIDIDYYIEKQIIPPSLRVLAAVGVGREQLI
ncbi:MAG: DNA-directed DNA polymerase [Candidatus Aenigmarchaeota archaeon]|nr:DNA-directed DNA polymerase [Candidatus Aenigmarchaeota archaeon]